MADRYLLESGSPDGYLLEDGTGVLLLEANRDWIPTDLGAACVGWFDIATASKVTLNGSNISAVTNDAGGSVTLAQATAGNQPAFTAGSGAFFALAATTYLSIANLSAATEYHYFIVGTPNANTSFRTALWAEINEHPLLIQSGTDNVGHFIGSYEQFSGVTAVAAAEALFYAHTTPSAVSQGATNGNTPGSTLSAYGATNTNAATLGNTTGGAQGFGSVKALVIVTGTLTSGDRQKVEGYLAWRYSSVNNLAAGHPYASAQPTIAIASGPTLTGQSLTVGQGSVVASVTLALTGQSLSIGQGTIGIGAALSGQSLSVSQGSTTPATSAALSGQSATVARGTITASPSLALSGQSLTVAQGTLSPNTAVSLTGQASSVAQGGVTQSRSIALSGQGAAVAQGSFGPAISVAISGQSLVVAQGTVVAVTGITAALTGQSLSVAQGSVAPALSLAISGQAISVAGGSLVPSITLAITGQALTTSSGLVSVLASTDVTRALTGQSISIALGSITASVTDEHYKFWRQPPLTGRRTSPGRSR